MEVSDDTAVSEVRLNVELRALEVVAYVGEFKVVGTAHFGIGQRTSSRRASDYLRAFSDTKMTLADVRIYGRERDEIVDTAPFVVLNLEKVDLIYARDEEETPPAGAAEPED
jgi:hypothetical protein